MSAAGAGVEELPGGVLRSRVHARIGLLGNPSDGFGGVCISLSLANHWAEVTLTPGGLALRLCPPGGDAAAGLADGGCRLMHATLLALEESLEAAGTPLPPGSAFSLAYSTTIPRQRGLSGSSAIAAAALNCLLRHYQLEAAVPVAQRPALLLRAEASMGITAGLQDRVIQTFGGLLLMDFSAPEPRLQRLDPSRLPPLWLIHRPGGEPGADSGAVHSDVKQRWLAGDADVRQGMSEIAALALRGAVALQAGGAAGGSGSWWQLGELMAANFSLRRRLYGDAVVGAESIAMVEAAKCIGAPAKLTGSGGAVVAVCPGGETQAAWLQGVCDQRGFACEAVRVGPVLHEPGS